MPESEQEAHSEKTWSMHEIFAQDGLVASYFPAFSVRENQSDMAREIFEALNTESNILIEAGTGLGKSLAYLVPALVHCATEGKRCAVSTETKTLQNQLITQEIPLVKKVVSKVTGIDIKYDVCLGSSNYVCIRRFESSLPSLFHTKEEKKSMKAIAGLLEEGKPFTRFDVQMKTGLWHAVSRDADYCLHSRCAHFAVCPFQMAKRSWNNATLLVINHYLFFSHIATGRTYLPYIDAIVFDEAHSIAEICKKQLGFEYDSDYLRRELPLRDSVTLFQKLQDDAKKQRLTESLASVHAEYDDFFTLLDEISGEEPSRLLPYPVLSGNRLTGALNTFLKAAEDLSENDAQETFFFELDGIQAKYLSLYNSLKTVTREREANWTYWTERKERTAVCAQPVDTAPLFSSEILPYFSSIAALSATLTIDNDFSYFKGLTDFHNFIEKIYPSGFNYKERVLLYFPEISASVKDETYIHNATESILEIAEATAGNVLVLFNSNRMLQLCSDLLEECDFPVISQLEYTPVEAVDVYKKEKSPLLLGTHSFWQGIDLPGDLLKAVIITRLPFPPPNRPDLSSVAERMKQEGRSPFEELFLPYAVIKFRQGFGRLMRGSSDAGIVAVLDDRIEKKRYGQHFLHSIPECTIVRDIESIRNFCDDFFRS